MRTATCLQPKVPFFAVLTLALLVGHVRSIDAQESGGVVPASHQSGSFFNKSLGTALRFNYHTQGYGTQDDVFSLGGMKVFNMDDATVFVDGQGTLSDDFGGGFNLGVGYRQLTTTGMSFDPQRILGVGFWTDGQSTASDNFFTQLGFSLESLGDSFDLRLNGSFPLERTQTSDAVLTGTGTPFFIGNNIFGETEEFTIDTAHTVVDGEFAKRIKNLEAWAFVGGYQIGGGGVDATGYRAGVRGYAVPDLALSLQVTDDDVYATNVMFGVTWFIGRTNKCNGPCGTLLDRFREPVQRNDFIAMTSRRDSRASGNALTDAATDEIIRLVHIDRNDGTTVAGGGDGTFENPFQNISDIDAVTNLGSSQEGDILLVHATSNFTGAEGVATLQSNQRLIGEGIDGDGNQIPHIVATNELGNINLPETAAADALIPVLSSLELARPTIDGTGLNVLTLANGSSVNNFTINGATTAVTATGISAPTGSMLANLTIDGSVNALVNGVLLENTTGTVVVENTVAINGATGIGLEVNGGADGMSLAASINDSTGMSLSIHDRTGGIVDYTGTIDDDATVAGNFSDGVLIDMNVDATVNLTNALDIRVDDGETAIQVSANTSTDAATPATVNASGAVDVTATGSGRGIAISGSDDTANITFADLDATAVDGNTVSVEDAGTMTFSSADDTRTIANTGTGNALFNSGGIAGGNNNAVLTVNSNITNSGGGQAVEIRDREENDVTIAGTVTVENGSGAGVLVEDNINGNILFSNTLTLDTGTNDAVVLTNNSDGTTDATISFSDLDIDTTTGNGFIATGIIATGGGNLIVTSTNGTNDITSSGTGVALTLTNMTIDPANVTFDTINATDITAPMAIDLQNLDGTGQVAIGGGTNAGDGGTLSTGAGTAISVDNVNNVVMTNLTISNGNVVQGAGLSVTGQLAGSTATFVGLEANTANADAVNVSGNTDGTIIFTDLTANTSGTGGAVVLNNNLAATVTVNDMTAAATGTGVGFRATGTGNLAVTGTTSVSTNTGQVLEIDGQVIAAAGAKFDTVNSTGTVAGSAVVLKDTTGGLVTVGSGTNAGDGGVVASTGTAMTVDNVESLVVNNVTVNNTAAAALNVTNQAAASTATFNTFTANTTTANAVTVSGNTAGTTIFSDLDVLTTDGTGVTVSNNGTATTTFNGMDVEATGTGVGFTSSGTGTLTATGTNTVTTESGVAVNLSGTTIGGAGASFTQVTVNNGTGSGIVLANLTGGQVRVGGATATGTDGAGGTINTTGTAISLVGVTNAVFNDVEATSTGAVDAVVVDHTSGTDSTVTFNNLALTATGNGISVTDNGTGEIDFTLRDSSVDVTVADTIGFSLITGNNTGEIDIRLDNNVILAADNSAVAVDLNDGTGDVQFLVNGGNDWSNNSATDATVTFLVSTDRTLNATIGDQTGIAPFDENRFANSNAAGTAFEMEVNSGAAIISLDLQDNNASGNVDYIITQSAGTFGVVDLTGTVTNDANNAGLVDIDGGNIIGDFINLAGPIKQVD